MEDKFYLHMEIMDLVQDLMRELCPPTLPKLVTIKLIIQITKLFPTHSVDSRLKESDKKWFNIAHCFKLLVLKNAIFNIFDLRFSEKLRQSVEISPSPMQNTARHTSRLFVLRVELQTKIREDFTIIRNYSKQAAFGQHRMHRLFLCFSACLAYSVLIVS